MPGVDLTDKSIIKLRPCKIVCETAERFGVIRRAGRSRVVVRSSGLEACELFREGCAIGEAKRNLAKRHQIAETAIDLSPLLRSLQNADLIASIDGKRIREACPPSIYSTYRYCLRFHLKPNLLQLAYKHLPSAAARNVAYWAYRLDLAARLWPRAIRAEEHMNASPAACLPWSGRQGFARRYLSHLIQNIVDFELVQAMAPEAAERWLDKHIDYEGLDNLDRPKNEGLPVIVAGLHFSATKLLALLLARRGYDVAQIWLPDGSVDLASVTNRLEALKKVRPEYGKLEIIPDFSLPSYRRLLKALRDRELLIWFADMFGDKEQPQSQAGDPDWRESAMRVFDFGQIKTELPQSKIDVMLCGQRVYLNPWIGGFARTAGAVIVPAAVIRKGARLQLTLLPALRLPAKATQRDVETLNRALFRQLDLLLRRFPDQWFGWHSLCPVREQEPGFSTLGLGRDDSRPIQQLQTERR